MTKMKIRESGMPEDHLWEKFFDIKLIFKKLEINNKIESLVDFGFGYGTFSVPAAEIISGKVIALDLENEMINYLREKIDKRNVKNIDIIKRDFIDQGSDLPNNSIDYVMLFNILHHDQPKVLLKEAYKILKLQGKLGIIHWNYDPTTPRGPPLAIRPKPENLISLATQIGFVNPILFDLKPFHYGILMKKEKLNR